MLSLKRKKCWLVTQRAAVNRQARMFHRALLNDWFWTSVELGESHSFWSLPSVSAVCFVALSLFPVVTWTSRNFLHLLKFTAALDCDSLWMTGTSWWNSPLKITIIYCLTNIRTLFLTCRHSPANSLCCIAFWAKLIPIAHNARSIRDKQQ